jgi:hypothetical protein
MANNTDIINHANLVKAKKLDIFKKKFKIAAGAITAAAILIFPAEFSYASEYTYLVDETIFDGNTGNTRPEIEIGLNCDLIDIIREIAVRVSLANLNNYMDIYIGDTYVDRIESTATSYAVYVIDIPDIECGNIRIESSPTINNQWSKTGTLISENDYVDSFESLGNPFANEEASNFVPYLRVLATEPEPEPPADIIVDVVFPDPLPFSKGETVLIFLASFFGILWTANTLMDRVVGVKISKIGGNKYYVNIPKDGKREFYD